MAPIRHGIFFILRSDMNADMNTLKFVNYSEARIEPVDQAY